ncbi:hypothetical protein D3C74_418290 [compost metagenome]
MKQPLELSGGHPFSIVLHNQFENGILFAGVHLQYTLAAKGFEPMLDGVLNNGLNGHLRYADIQPALVDIHDDLQPSFQADGNDLQIMPDLLQLFTQRNLCGIFPLAAVAEHGRQGEHQLA